MPGPQSTAFFLLLIALFGGLVWWLITARQVVFRLLAALLAFIPAMMFGVAAVNKYYGYYQTWSSAFADITSQGPLPLPSTVSRRSGAGLAGLAGHSIDNTAAAQQGLLLRLQVSGPLSGLSRAVYVFLPPQYFWAGSYQQYRFPVVELIHGFPGQAQDWITVLGANSVLDTLVRQHEAQPAVLVMPDANGGRGISLQCLNQVGGPQDATFLAEDLPTYIARLLRVQPPGAGWGVAGYSEGGFCAANFGLQYGRVFSYAGVMSGYFKPTANQLVNPTRLVSPFGGNHALAMANTPLDVLSAVPIGRLLAHFWLGASLLSHYDVRNAETFGQLLQLRQPDVTIKLVPGGGHTTRTWRILLPPMLHWITTNLAQQAAIWSSPAARQRRAAALAAARYGRLHHQLRRPGVPPSATGSRSGPRKQHRAAHPA